MTADASLCRTAKRRFANRGEAIAALRNLTARRASGVRRRMTRPKGMACRMREYRCPHCAGWHIGSALR